jgi:hypothetical protein
MMRTTLSRWLQAFPLTGRLALLCMLVSVGLPTIVRAAVHGVMTGCEFTPYLPFVLISAILLRWWQASAVALASVAILGGLFAGPTFELAAPCFISGAGMFLASSALIIGVAIFVRGMFGALQDRGADESAGGIVFSLEQGTVWASWYGQGSPVRLGSQRRVSEMMKDFLAQEELAKRLNRRS